MSDDQVAARLQVADATMELFNAYEALIAARDSPQTLSLALSAAVEKQREAVAALRRQEEHRA